jgi:hypothetical protein
MKLNFEHDGCCEGYNIATVNHDNGLRTIVEKKSGEVYTCLTMLGFMPHIPLIQGMSRDDVDTELGRVAEITI